MDKVAETVNLDAINIMVLNNIMGITNKDIKSVSAINKTTTNRTLNIPIAAVGLLVLEADLVVVMVVVEADLEVVVDAIMQRNVISRAWSQRIVK